MRYSTPLLVRKSICAPDASIRPRSGLRPDQYSTLATLVGKKVQIPDVIQVSADMPDELQLVAAF